ncbi:MAG: hypothetical protein LBC41_06195, partial [Clostridiales bacterium]|nr:hypothetical protein [Clostridiales bacterium]
MKKAILALIFALILLSACKASDTPVPEETPANTQAPVESEETPEPKVLIGGDMRTATLIFDFTGGLLEESLREESFNTFEEITPKLLAECLSWWSGLKFDVTASFDDYGIIVDWAPSSSLFAGLDSAEQKEGFVFADEDAMRWFMLDSLWRTFSSEFGGEVFFTMNGGEPLVF